jgi:hypothetical protein
MTPVTIGNCKASRATNNAAMAPATMRTMRTIKLMATSWLLISSTNNEVGRIKGALIRLNATGKRSFQSRFNRAFWYLVEERFWGYS